MGTNASAAVADAENYHAIRVFTVGQATADLENVPMDDLQTVQSGWSLPVGDAFNNSNAGGQFGQCKDRPFRFFFFSFFWGVFLFVRRVPWWFEPATRTAI